MSAQLSSQTESIAVTAQPAFLIGRDPEGHWVAVETHGFGGGLFHTREAAEDYAEFETARRPGAILFVEDPVPLTF